MKPIRFFLNNKSFKRNVGAESFFSQPKNNEMQIGLDIDIRKLDLISEDVDNKDFYEVSILFKTKEPDNLYEYDCKYSGLFEFEKEAFSETELKQILNIHCPSMIYPYIRMEIERELISSGLPPLILPPLNFATIYSQKNPS